MNIKQLESHLDVLADEIEVVETEIKEREANGYPLNGWADELDRLWAKRRDVQGQIERLSLAD